MESRRKAQTISSTEHRLMEECWEESIWRALPLATLTGAATFISIRRGKLKPSSRFGPWPKTLGASFVAYWVGKFSYLMGRACQDKFLREAPHSDIASHIREQRSLPHPPNMEKLTEEAVVMVDEEEEEEYTLNSDGKEISVRLSAEEKVILETCRSVSILFYSLPTSFFAGSVTFAAQAKGIISESKRLGGPFKKMPKVALAAVAGYFIGQFAYLFSSDCLDRFLENAPEGNMANAIRQIKGDDIIKHQAEKGVVEVESDDRTLFDEYYFSNKQHLIDFESATSSDVLRNSLESD